MSQDTKQLILGVDPGLSGAIVVLDNHGDIRAIHDMPVVNAHGTRKDVLPQALAQIVTDLTMFHDVQALHAFVEQVTAVGAPGRSPGAGSSFKFGTSYGMVLGMLAGTGVSYTLLRPVVWKRVVQLGKGKDAARAMACQTWPGWADRFVRVKDDGRADAALIALSGLKSGLGLAKMPSTS